ncbi:unnamed protein product [Nezara viridula]|uniref:Uncharacterized protein n=1 Tax=Nezara viridula TaxID=85310 RepID=A0A9P0H2I8_NEZVI|nr:unnamed protein product [Nezara viridula]
MSSFDHVGPPRLLNSEVLLPNSGEHGNPCCILKLNVENKSNVGETTKEYNIGLPSTTLNILLDSFGKIKNQLHLLTEKQNS